MLQMVPETLNNITGIGLEKVLESTCIFVPKTGHPVCYCLMLLSSKSSIFARLCDMRQCMDKCYCMEFNDRYCLFLCCLCRYIL